MPGDTMEVADAAEIMASIDTAEQEPRLVIADISVDGAWLSMPAARAPSIAESR